MGVAVRSMRGVQLEFMFGGERCTETIPGKPTVGAVFRARDLRATILGAIQEKAFDYKSFFPSSRRVLRERKQQQEAAAAQADVDTTTMDELFTDFLSRFIKNKPGSQTTHHTHKEVVRSHLRAAFGALRPREVTADRIIDFRHGLRTRGLSDTRLSNVLTPLRGAIALAIERKLIQGNPFDQVAPTKPKRQQVIELDENGLPRFDEPLPHHTDRQYAKAAAAANPLNAEERMAVLGATHGQYRNLVCFGFWSGLRTGELIALRWCDVDWDNARIIVRISFSKFAFTPTKGKRQRWVPLLPPALQALRNQYELTGQVDRWVFNNPVTHDRWSSSERLRRRWVRALKRAKVAHRPQYQTRHTYASIRMSAGDGAFEVADAMGHMDVRLVSVVYARWDPKTKKPGSQVAEAYAQEWADLSTLLADNPDVVTGEDLEDDALPDNGPEEVDPLDKLDRGSE